MTKPLRTRTKTSENYYINHKQTLLRDFDKTSQKFGRKALDLHFDADSTEKIIRESREEFEVLIPKLPYVGGKKSIWTTDLVRSAWALALYRTVKAQGKTAEDTGEILTKIVEMQLYSYPRFIRYLVGRWSFNRFSLRKMKKQASESQKRLFLENWIWNYISGDGKEFDFGYDITDCGLCKFFHNEGADELVPYLCATEFLKSTALGIRLVRKTTLAESHDKCNFRYKKGRVK